MGQAELSWNQPVRQAKIGSAPLVDLALQDADAGKRPVSLVVIESESDDKPVRDFETTVLDRNIDQSAGRLVEKGCNHQAAGLPA